MWQILIFIGFIIGIRVVAALVSSRPMPPNECDFHSWTRKDVDYTDPSMGTYMVCTKCKRLPSGDFEQS